MAEERTPQEEACAFYMKSHVNPKPLSIKAAVLLNKAVSEALAGMLPSP